MIKFLKNNYLLLLIFATSFIIFFPSLFGFYTNDDFFCLKISNFSGLPGFINFFSFLKGPGGWGLYRPLTVQAFYSLGWKVFNLNPLYLHIVLFALFFILIYLVYELVLLLSKDKKLSLIATFLYAVSATHFAHLYFLSTQELGLGVFVLLTIIFGLKYFREEKLKYFGISMISFILSIFSKETAVVTPALLLLVYFYEKYRGGKVINFKKLIIFVLPFAICLFTYLLIRIFSYGFTTGDSYVWDFSIKRLINTEAWYFAWSFGLPESLVDFVGPGLHINPNLWLYWSKQIIPIFILFTLEILITVYAFIKSLFTVHRSLFTVLTFSILWFLICILPVSFLPFHKFSFYLTLPLVGVVYLLSYLFVNLKSKIIILFCMVWLILSVLTVKYSVSTSWITQGENLSRRVYNYFQQNEQSFKGKKIVFTDVPEDANLPWSPTTVVSQALSDKNFFEVFFPELAGNVSYTGKGDITIKSRQFLGY